MTIANAVRFGLSFIVLVGCAIRAHAADSPAPAAKPNVLFIISDDLNTFLGCYGDPRAKTPNIDRLATRGVRFERAYCQYPLCGPSRNSLLTGLYPNSTGILTNGQVFRQTIPDQVSLPQLFRQAGYFVGRIGKLYHYNVPNSIGTNGHDDPASWELELNRAGADRLDDMPHITTLLPNEFGATLSWYASPHPDARHTDGMAAADADWVLARCAQQKDRPFFLAVGFFRPHTPYVAPREPYFGMYPEAEMPLVEGIEEDQADLPKPALESRKKTELELPDDVRRKCLQAYYASISFMDAQLGHVIDALDRHGLAENTIIVFTSDHGYHMGEHGLWQKRSLFEESHRVPLLIVAPGTSRSGATAKTPVGHVDLFPTLTELCNLNSPDNVQGQSLAPMLRDANVAGRGWALTQVGRGGGGQGRKARPFSGYSLRTPRWRYTEWDEGRKGRELYDHEQDPRELTNLADDASQAATVSELSKQLRDAVRSTFPPGGKVPELRSETWAPTLTQP